VHIYTCHTYTKKEEGGRINLITATTPAHSKLTGKEYTE
jgi:hypothetical protein